MSGLIGDIVRSYGLPPLERAAGMLRQLRQPRSTRFVAA